MLFFKGLVAFEKVASKGKNRPEMSSPELIRMSVAELPQRLAQRA